MKFLRENRGEFFSVDEIISILGIDLKPRDVYNHLAHIAKTIRRRSNGQEVLVMSYPRCRKCGYIFKSIDKPKKPSRCPRCGSEWIEPPRFSIIVSK
ncbi:MAG: transcriptional regulator [Desulfurococcales archaeon]|nr:transcriptional regulator [Desulfurococcales archaeon]